MFLDTCLSHSYPHNCPQYSVENYDINYGTTVPKNGDINMADLNLQFKQVAALPGTLLPHTVYMVKSAQTGLMELFVTGANAAEPRHIINRDEISTMITNAVSSATAMQFADTIAQRDTIVLPQNGLVLVRDATGDATVTSGAALYTYDADKVLNGTETNADRYSKIAEYESLDLTWDSIVGGPESSAAQVDEAVAQRHTHANKVQLDLITERADGEFLYDGSLVLARAVETSSDW